MSPLARPQQHSRTGLAIGLILALLLHLGLLWTEFAEPMPQRPQGTGQALQLQLTSRAAASSKAEAANEQITAAITPTPEPAASKAEHTPPTPTPKRPTLAKAPQPKPASKPEPAPKAATPQSQPPAKTEPAPQMAESPLEQPLPPQVPGIALDQPGSPERDAYLALLRQRLQKAQRYPRSAQRRRLEGTVQVRFSITAAGQLQDGQVELLASSGIQALDRAALASVRRAAPFPSPPRALITLSQRIEVSLPVEFQLN